METTLKSKAHYEIISAFDLRFKCHRLDKEPKAMWVKGRIYEDGYVNDLFLAFRAGVSYGLAVSD